MWEAENGKAVRSLRGTPGKALVYGGWAGGLSVSPDGSRITALLKAGVGVEGGGVLNTWDDGENQTTVFRKGGPIVSVTYAPDGATLVAADATGVVTMSDVRTGRPLWTSQLQIGPKGAGPGLATAFHPDAKVLFAATGASDLTALDAATGRSLAQMGGSDVRFRTVAVSPDGTRLVAGGRSAEPKGPVIGATGLTADHSFEGKLRPFDVLPEGVAVNDLVFAPDGKGMAAACTDGFVRVFDAKEGKLTAAFKVDAKTVYAVRYAPDGRRLLAVGEHAASVLAVAELMKRKPE